MAIYFLGQYPELYETLSTDTMLAESKSTLSTAIDEVSSEMSGVTGLITELTGDYSGELAESLMQLVDELNVTYTTVTEGLNGAVQEMTDLSTNLGEFKTNDEDLESKNSDLSTEENRSVKHYEDEERTIVTDEYKRWQSKLSELRTTIAELKEIIGEWKDKCDTNISNIDAFNENIVTIRLKMATIAFLNEGYSLEDIQNLSPEERQQLIAKLVNNMTVVYNQYKAAYEEFAKTLALDKYDTLRMMSNLYRQLTGEPSGIDFAEGDATKFSFDVVDFFLKVQETKNSQGKSFLDCLKDYRETRDFSGSGLLDFYKAQRDVPEGMTDEQLTDFFKELFDEENYPDPGFDESVDTFLDNYDEISNIASQFNDNYKKAVETGVAVKGLQELAGHVRYDAMYLRDDFASFNDDTWTNDEFLNKIYVEGFDINKLGYLTQDEMKMFRYLYDRENPEAAMQYMEDMRGTLNRREGYVRATTFYMDLMDGSNHGIDWCWDHLRTGGTGYGDGLSGYIDGFVDLVAPSKELSADDYAQAAFIGYLTEGGTAYDTSLLTAYNLGSAAGKQTIPALISLVNPTLGKASVAVSDFGNNIETYMQSEEGTGYFDAFMHSAVTVFGDKGIEAIAGYAGFDGPVANLVVAATKGMYGDAANAIYGGEPSYGGAWDEAKKGMSGNVAETAADWFKGYLVGKGVPEGLADHMVGAVTPGVQTLTNAAINTGEAVGTTAIGNAVTGGNADVLAAAGDAFGGTVSGELGKNTFENMGFGD